MPSEGARLGGNAFLHVAVTAQTDDMIVKNHMLARVKTRRGHFRGYGHADSIADALTERSRSAFHSGRIAKFRMSRRFRMQLPETFDFRHRQIVTAHVQPGVEKHAAVTAGEDEAIAIDPTRLVRIVF